jgi:hypothetical protein
VHLPRVAAQRASTPILFTEYAEAGAFKDPTHDALRAETIALLRAWEDLHHQAELEYQLEELQAAYDMALRQKPRNYRTIAWAGGKVDAFAAKCNFARSGADILAELQRRSEVHKEALVEVCEELVAGRSFDRVRAFATMLEWTAHAMEHRNVPREHLFRQH